ncbi:MAG TPA: ferrochelatase [Candidatus Binataceae bacterium]|nr:ferrochelatase [Candidatus Binataceae bacterium]
MNHDSEMNEASATDALLLIGFGGPEGPAQVRPFLDRVLQGRPVPRERYEEVARHYEVFGGYSPYNDLTRRLADAVREALRRQANEIPIAIGMRNTEPYMVDAIRALMDRGVKRACGFILSAFRCDASWERYQRETAATCETLGAAAPTIVYPTPWHTRPQFIEALADRLREALAASAPRERDNAELIFTAHSIPCLMAAASPYVEQLRETAALAAAAVGIDHWTLAFQSRSGAPRDPWLEPDVRDVIVADARPKIVMPLGFLSDHVEVLYDLDVEAADAARAAGVSIRRAGTVGDHPAFVDLTVEITLESLAGAG